MFLILLRDGHVWMNRIGVINIEETITEATLTTYKTANIRWSKMGT